jgi:hypothetical protein
MSNPLDNVGGSERLTQKWEPVLEGINDNYTRKVTAALLENQAKAILNDREKMISEAAVGTGTTTVGMLGTFQKFAMPIVRRVYPNLIFNQLGATQPMQGPVSQVFYLGHNRVYGPTVQNVYSKFNMTYRGLEASRIGSASGSNEPSNPGTFTDGQYSGLAFTNYADFDASNVINTSAGGPTATFGGKIASWPDSGTTLGWTVSAGERLQGTSIPEISLQIQTQPVTARTRKMRALWTLEASQDLKAYHNLDLEQELTSLLSNELQLEIDRELIEDMRMIAYGFGDRTEAFGGWYPGSLDPRNTSNAFPPFTGKEPHGENQFTPGGFEYEMTIDGTGNAVNGVTAKGINSTQTNAPGSNIFVVDLDYYRDGTGAFAPQHIGHVYSNLLATLNFASQDIYRTTFRGPGSWMITSPLIAAMLESAAKLEGGINAADRPSNIGNTSIEFKGKFAGRYDLYVDPMFPTDEILMGYKGSGPMDSGFIYCPYIPLQQLPTITDPESFQPRKGLLTRYGKVAIQPASRFFRVIRIVGAGGDYLVRPMERNARVYNTPTNYNSF